MSSYYYRQDSGIFSKRMIIFAAIVVFHVLIIWAFIVGFTNSGRALIQTILQTNIIQQQKETVLPPPPPQAKLNVQVQNTVVTPEFAINIPVAPPPIHVAKPPPAAPKPIIHVNVPIVPVKVTFSPDPQDYYPESSRRNNEEGRVMVHICVDVRGRVATADVQASSGHTMLDQAGVQLAKATRFKPATRAGKPVEQCTLLPVKFVLTGG
ncbi:MAG TPA: energy transducer TonB [Steroidobacteraceae bacterium]|jgi:TonB family protein|nr:energy transducer TonB [Steroidobacteraceae bacterium]